MIIIIVILLLVVSFCLFLLLPRFGSSAKGQSRAIIERSPNFKNGQFQNISETPQLTEGATIPGILREFLFQKNKRSHPSTRIPAAKVNLNEFDLRQDMLVWFGHSSYFLQLDGKRFLVDPVLSGHASPLAFTTRSFKGSDAYTAEDIPFIDYILITHDHYDHLDYQTMVKLRPRAGKVITGLGVGAHLRRWGYDTENVIEKDWNEELEIDPGIKMYTLSARHFSGRTFKRNTTLWLSFVVITSRLRIYIGGDSGYDDHFKKTGERFGPFDLAILENGQYNKSWKYIHMMPEEVVCAAIDLKAKRILPVHWSKFSLALHAWDEPIIRLIEEAKKNNLPVLHPMIGEAVDLHGVFNGGNWWETIK